MAHLMKVDMTAIPRPLPLTMKISTSSRRRLKYCATISVEQSRVRPTPTPITVPGTGFKVGVIFLIFEFLSKHLYRYSLLSADHTRTKLS